MRQGFPVRDPREPVARPARRRAGLRTRAGGFTVLGGILLGAGVSAPGFAAIAEDPPPPRLRLALELEGLTRPRLQAPNETVPAASERLDSVAAELPPLRLAIALLPVGGPGSPAPSRGGPDLPVLAAPPPRPEPRDKSSSNGPPLVPPRPERVVQPARTDAVAQSALPPRPPASPRPAGAAKDAALESGAARSGSDASVVGDDEFLPADELGEPLPTTPRPQPAATTAPPSATSGPRRNWGVAPIRWGGTLSTGFRRYQSEDSPASLQQVYEARARASSFIMQPYIALVSGDVGLTMVRAASGGDGSAAGSNLIGTSINGGGTLSVFPQSRFPFQASLAVSDSRSDGSLTSTNTSRRRLSLRQDYSPREGNWNASGQYDRSDLQGDFGNDVVDRLSGSYATTVAGHGLTANASLSSNRTSSGDSTDLYAAGGHSYRLSDAWALDSSATYTSQDFHFDENGNSVDGTATSAQLFSFATWNPADTRWRGTVNARYFQTESTFSGGTFATKNFGGSSSLSFQANRNLSVFGTFGLNSSGSGQYSTSQSLGLSYSGDPLTWGEYQYNWHGSSSVSNSTSSRGDSAHSGSVSLGHSVNRNWHLSDMTLLNGSVNQSVGMTRSTGLGSITNVTLNHTGSLTLQVNPNDQLSGYISASASDNRVSGDATSSFQLFNMQVSGRWRINVYSELNSNLTWQVSNQKNSQQDDFTQDSTIDPETGQFRDTSLLFRDDGRSRTSSLSGNLGYGHVRVFGIRGLRYSLDFRADTSQTRARRARQFGDPDAERESPSLDLDQRLKYRIGRLDTELQFRVAEFQERRSSLIFFRVSRDFGAF